MKLRKFVLYLLLVTVLLLPLLNFLIPKPQAYDEDYSNIWTADSYFHKKIKENPVIDENSNAMIQHIIAGGDTYVKVNYNSYTKPLYDATEDTPRRNVYTSSSLTTVRHYNVPIELSWQPAQEADHSFGVIDWENRVYYDYWHFYWVGSQCYADDGYAYDMDDDGVLPHGTWGIGGSGISMLSICVRDEEIDAGVINHPLGGALSPPAENHVYPPASHHQTTSSHETYPPAIPMGARIQLNPSVDLDAYGLNPTAKIIAKALQDYGFVVKEAGGDWHLYMEHENSAGSWSSYGVTRSILNNLNQAWMWRVIDFDIYPATDDESEFELPQEETFVPWTDNFESGDLSKWTSTSGSASVTSTYAHSGTYSANLTASPSEGGWLDGWDKRVKFTLDHNDFDEVLTNFPLYLHICGTAAGRYDEDISFVFDEIGANSKKIAFTTSDGETETYGGIELWDSAGECARLWVDAPSISNVTDTEFYLYYDNDHADNTAYINDSGVGNATKVWDADFMMVQHMTGASYSALDDATSNNNDVDAEGGTPDYNQAGRCAKCVNLEADSTEYVRVHDDGSLDGYSSGMTLESWVKLESVTDVRPIFGKYYTTGDQRAYFLAVYDSTHLWGVFSSGGDNYVSYKFTDKTYDISTWYYIVFEWISDAVPKAYCDGVELTAVQDTKTEPDWTTSTIYNSNENLYLGYIRHAVEYMDGLLDEMRISNISRSAAWINSCYETERDETIDWFSEEVGGGGGESAYIYHTTVSMTELNARVYAQFEDLPDSNHTAIKFMEFQTATGTLIGNVMLYRLDSTYYWSVQVAGEAWYGGNKTSDTINADTFYALELYMNVTSNGNITLWNDEVLKCQNTGDYSGFGEIGRVVLFSYLGGNMSTSKTVYFDNFEVNDQRIYGKGGGSPTGTHVLFSASSAGYGIEGVTINGTRYTDLNGYYEWANLTYNNIYKFVVNTPDGYYPGWILNVNGNFTREGSQYVISHNLTEGAVYIKIFFQSANDVYIKQSAAKLTNVILDSATMGITANDTGTKTILVDATQRGEPTSVTGASHSYSNTTKILTLNVTFSSSQTVTVSWEEPMNPTGPWDITWYMQEDTHTVNTVLGYELEETVSSTSTYATASETGDLTAYFGWRVWVVNIKGEAAELTSETRYGWRVADGQGLQNVSWTTTGATLHVGFDAIMVKLYLKFGDGSWSEKATFISDTLDEKSVTAYEWVFQAYTKRIYSGGTTSAWVYWGDTYATAVGNVFFVDPNVYEAVAAKLQGGDFIGAILFPYLNLVGNLFYGLVLLMVFVPLYNRYKSVTPLLVILLIFGGAGGVLTLLIPSVGLGIGWIFFMLGLAGLLYKVFR